MATMLRTAGAALALLAALVLSGGREAQAKGDKAKREPPKTGVFRLSCTQPCQYAQMAVPADYDATRFYPLLVILHSDGAKAEDFLGAWWEVMEKRGWILVAPAFEVWQDEGSVSPIQSVVSKVKETYRIDDRRVVLAGHNSGAKMAWRMMIVSPDAWAGIVAFSADISDADRAQLKKVVGKSVYLFRGARDNVAYTAPLLERDRKYLEGVKITPTIEVRPDWGIDFPRPSIPGIAAWLDKVWPAGSYREKADAVEEAIAAHDLAAAQKAHADLQSELKKSPYPAFEVQAGVLWKRILDQARGLVTDAQATLAADPLAALSRMEAAVKATKGLAPVDKEAAQALQALKKDPKVLAALGKKKAEEDAVTYMKRAEAAEAKGDLAKALDWYRKIAALGETSKKAEAEAKIQELEPKVGGK